MIALLHQLNLITTIYLRRYVHFFTPPCRYLIIKSKKPHGLQMLNKRTEQSFLWLPHYISNRCHQLHNEDDLYKSLFSGGLSPRMTIFERNPFERDLQVPIYVISVLWRYIIGGITARETLIILKEGSLVHISQEILFV